MTLHEERLVLVELLETSIRRTSKKSIAAQHRSAESEEAGGEVSD